MIKKLRHQFIWIAMICVGILLIFNLLVINISVKVSNKREADKVLERVIRAEGQMNPPLSGMNGGMDGAADPGSREDGSADPDGRRRISRISSYKRTFAVKLDDSGRIFDIVDNGSSSLTEEEIREAAAVVQKSGRTAGMIGNHRYRSAGTPYGTIIAFLDCSKEQDSMKRLVLICLTAGCVCILILFLLVLKFSKWAVRPVEEGFRRQRQFIADAGHELKTPLAVISSNTSVLESLNGKSQWTDYIQKEVERMGRLINDMLKLAMMERPEGRIKQETFDFSSMATQVFLSYESMAYEQMKQFGYFVEPDLKYQGDEDALNQMLHIFVDNAFKYSGAGGKVEVNVKKEKKGISIEVHNTGSGIKKEAQDHVFERFYREESAHSRETDGYGLGLAIAKEIIERHRGKVQIKSDEENYVSFFINI